MNIKKKMIQIRKYPPKAALDFSKSKDEHEISLYIKYAKTKKTFF
jgi:hypothetical protein